MTSSSLDLACCSASDLTSYLIHHRFQNNVTATATFLKECSTAALSAIDEKQDTAAPPNLGQAVCSLELSMMQPRGKFQCTFHSDGLSYQTVNKKDFLVISHENVQRLILFPKPEDCRKTTFCNMVLIVLKDVIFKAKVQAQICFQIPAGNCNGNCNWMDTLCQSLHINPMSAMHMVPHPKSNDHERVFRSFANSNSSSTTADMPFVHCYNGTNDGVLYPMESGLLFFKPPLFIHRSQLHSISCGRGSTKYVDLKCHIDNEDKTLVEFTNIAIEQVQVLNDYIQKTLIPAMKKDVDGVLLDEEKEEDSTEDESDDRVKRRSKRKGIQEVRAATKKQLIDYDDEDTDDEEDDVDYAGSHDDEEDDEDDDDSEESSDYDIGDTHSVEGDELAALGNTDDENEK